MRIVYVRSVYKNGGRSAVSEGPVGPVVLVPVEELKIEEIKKEVTPKKISSRDLVNKFLENEGAQQEYLEILKSLYGEKLVMRTFPKGWKETLSKENCFEIIERIGHGITIDDLEEFYAELKSGAIKCAVLNHALVPYLRMYWANSVKELPPYWLGHFVDLFRDPMKELKLGDGPLKIEHLDRGATLYTHYSHQVQCLMEKGDFPAQLIFRGTNGYECES